MNKKIICTALCLLLLLGFCGCRDTGGSSSAAQSDNSNESSDVMSSKSDSSGAFSSSEKLNASGAKDTSSGAQSGDSDKKTLRGVFYNPGFSYPGIENFPFPAFSVYTAEDRNNNRKVLRELVKNNINMVTIFVSIPYTLQNPAVGFKAGAPILAWGNFTYLDNLALFIDDCYIAGISVGLDLADHRWVPYSVAPEGRVIGNPGDKSWPVADDDPWNEAATWYCEVIEYIESKTKHPESIDMWCMMGNYQLGSAEPMLWGDDGPVLQYTERFVKEVWPKFVKAGKRPKGSPYMLPIFAKNSYWNTKSADEKLAAFHNLKKWLVDDLKLPPDYWMMTTYPFCDKAEDGVDYLKKIVDIIGRENASKIISTDLKSEGHMNELENTLIVTDGKTGAQMLEWHMQKVEEYGFGGWWIWNYQDTLNQQAGIRKIDGAWKKDLLKVIAKYAD